MKNLRNIWIISVPILEKFIKKFHLIAHRLLCAVLALTNYAIPNSLSANGPNLAMQDLGFFFLKVL